MLKTWDLVKKIIKSFVFMMTMHYLCDVEQNESRQIR